MARKKVSKDKIVQTKIEDVVEESDETFRDKINESFEMALDHLREIGSDMSEAKDMLDSATNAAKEHELNNMMVHIGDLEETLQGIIDGISEYFN